MGHLPGFDASDEVHTLLFLHLLQERIGLLYQGVALFFLQSDVQDRDFRVFDPESMFHIDGAHLGKLLKMGGSCVNVGARVQKKGHAAVVCGKDRRKGSSFDPLDASHDHLPAYKNSAGASGRDKGVCFLVPHELHAHDDGGIFLGSDRSHRSVSGLNDFRCVHDLQASAVFNLIYAIGLQFFPDEFFFSHQEHLDILFRPQRLKAPFDDLRRGIVPSHRINCYSYHIAIISLSDFEKNPEHTVPGSAKNIFKKLCLSLRP